MITWIVQNAATIIICAVLVIIVAVILRYMFGKNKKNGGSCGGNCAGCSMGGMCHKG